MRFWLEKYNQPQEDGRLGIYECAGGSRRDYRSDWFDMKLDEWRHVAVTVSHNPPCVTFYVDGNAISSFTDPHPVSGDLWGVTPKHSHYPKMDIGHGYPCYFATSQENMGLKNNFFSGKLDEIEIFNRALDATEIKQIYDAGSCGKCRDHCYVPSVTPFCINETEKTIDVTICNESNDNIVYHLDLYGISPSDCGGNFSWSNTDNLHCANTPSVSAGEHINVLITIDRPAGFGADDVACYCARISNNDTNEYYECCGKIIGTDKWCPEPDPDPVSISVYDFLAVPFVVKNTGDSTNLFDYVISTRSGCCADSTSRIVSLNELPPGTDVTGSISIPSTIRRL